MKKYLLCAMVLAACCLLAPRQTHAQYAYGISDIASSQQSREVYGYSGTWLDYYAGYYYDPAVQGELYWQFNNELPLSKGYTEGYADWIPAEVWTLTAQYRPVTRYTVYSNHFVRAYYYYSACYGFAAGCYSDPYGFSFFSDGGYGGYPGSYYNPYYYVGSRRYYLGTTSISLTTPSDQCSTGMQFDEVGNPCPNYVPPPVPPPPPTESLSIDLSTNNLRPDGTGGTTSASVEVRTVPANMPVTLRVLPASDPAQSPDWGGHVAAAHTGQRPRGHLDKSRGQTDGNGVFRTTFRAPIFNSPSRIEVTSGNLRTGVNVFIKVDGLVELGPGENYVLIGCDNTPAHPCGTNHWGTPAANQGLVAIADDYKNVYYPQGIPHESKINYNDQSLPYGGKFDLNHNWSAANIDHAEHRVGINCDTRSNNIPRERWARLKEIFINHGSTRTNDETDSKKPHWHLRFEFGTPPPRARRAAATAIPEVWWGALNQDPSEDEFAYWAGRISDAQFVGHPQTLAEMKALNRSLFFSDAYVARNRSDEDFVTDLYVTYLLREPDADGYNDWLTVLRDYNANGINGREHLVRGFEDSVEFSDVVASLDAITPPEEPTLCDAMQEQNCYNQGGAWDSTNCSCIYIQPEPEPEPDPCYGDYTYAPQDGGSTDADSQGASPQRPVCW
jgi:hypothetical protein